MAMEQIPWHHGVKIPMACVWVTNTFRHQALSLDRLQILVLIWSAVTIKVDRQKPTRWMESQESWKKWMKPVWEIEMIEKQMISLPFCWSHKQQSKWSEISSDKIYEILSNFINRIKIHAASILEQHDHECNRYFLPPYLCNSNRH